jgi:hypothetical protein
MLFDIILIIWAHAIGDFIFQTRTIAQNKSSHHWALGAHCTLYMIPLFVISWQFALVNCILHYPVDFVSSQLTSYYHKKENENMFFNVIGIDQAVHFTILFLTYSFLKGAV